MLPRSALDTHDGVEAGERAVIAYLIGELWRRIGDTSRANEWFALVPHEVTDRVQQAWVVRAATQQSHDPREWFD